MIRPRRFPSHHHDQNPNMKILSRDDLVAITAQRPLTWGIVCRSTGQLDIVRTPANRLWYVSAAYMARAPPCEKPPNKVLTDDTLDDAISSSMKSCSLSTARIMLVSSSSLFSSSDTKSNHADVGKPLFNVSGIFFLRQKYDEIYEFSALIIYRYYRRAVRSIARGFVRAFTDKYETY